MRRVFLAMFYIMLSVAPLLGAYPVFATNQRKALILSSVEQIAPTAYAKTVQAYLTQAGYSVTCLRDQAVTLDIIAKHLNDYDLILWRTSTYEHNHVIYWYVGEYANARTSLAYATEVQAGWVDGSNGILGVSAAFFQNYFKAGSLARIKIMILVSSDSSFLGYFLLNAGVKSIVDYYDSISLSFTETDYVTVLLVRLLASGENVHDSVMEVVSIFSSEIPRDELDYSYVPPIFWLGDSAMTMT